MIWPFQERAYALVRGKERLVHSVPALPDAWDATALGAMALAVAGAGLVAAIHRLATRADRG
jgi:hypothetical protein